MDSPKTQFREIPIGGNAPVNTSIYPSNKMHLSKYSWLILIPKNLFEQFQRVANIWFLLVSIFQLLPYQLNPTESWTTIAPLSVLILISLAQDAYNDFLLYKKLGKLNEEVYGIWFGDEFVGVKAENILVGQIILLKPGDRVPADIILLSRASNDDSVFIDMTKLLGVSTVKRRAGIEKVEKVLGIGNDIIDLQNLCGDIKLVEPSPDYNSTNGSLKLFGHPSASEIKPENFLFAGSRLKGSGPVIGFVAYCGIETKMLLNSISYRKKSSRIEETINKWVLFILIFVCLLVIASVIGYYLIGDNNVSTISVIITFTLLYSNLVPISLFVSIDIIRMLQSYIFRKQNVCFSYNTDDLNENMGQIEYIVTDKTFTLTKNLKKVKYCVINGEIYTDPDKKIVNSVPESGRALLILENNYQHIDNLKELIVNANQMQLETHFVKCLCICNSLTYLNDEFLGIDEEIALVKAAENFGFKLEINKKNKIGIKFQNSQMPFNLIAHKPFDSKLQKARVLVEDILNNCGVFYAKGTRQAMMHLLNLNAVEQDDLKLHIEELESQYCRVLILGYKVLSTQELMEYKTKIKRIEKSLLNSQGKIEQIFKQIEKSMKFIGLVGISEEIEHDAIQTIKRFKKGGIKVWLTSSDSFDNTSRFGKETELIDPDYLLEILNFKSEIAFSRFMKRAVKHLIYERGDPIVIRKTLSQAGIVREEDEEENESMEFSERPEITNNDLFRAVTFGEIELDDILNKPFDPFCMDFSVVIDRTSFLIALNDEKCRKILVCVLACASSVCFVEMMPKDKAFVVKLLKENFSFSPCVAAIGSTESDINMLQLADIGIAVRKNTNLSTGKSIDDENPIHDNHDTLVYNYADIVIDEFAQLDKLVLIEGHYNYFRMSKVILLFLYKNCLLTLIQVAFSFISQFSGNSIYSSSLLVGYNIFFTTIPILFIGIFDEDIGHEKITFKPQIYSVGIVDRYFNWRQLLKYFLYSLIQSIILSLLCFEMPSAIFLEGKTEDILTNGTFIYITLILTVLTQISIDTNCYSIYYFLTHLFSILSLIIFIIIVSESDFPNTSLNSVGTFLTQSPYAMFTIFFTSLACIVPTLFYSTFKELFNSSLLEYLKSNRNIAAEESNICQYSECLSGLYKASSGWKSRLEQLKFQNKKYSLTFKLPHIETKYAESFIRTHLKEFKCIIFLAILILILWVVLGLTIIPVDLGYTLARIVLLLGSGMFLFFLFTSQFQQHYRVYTSSMILIGMLSKFILEVIFKKTSFLATALIPVFTFLVFNVQYITMCWLNLLNVILFVISVSIEFSSKYPPGESTIFSLKSIVLIISITLNSGIQSFYCEKSSRTEYELINKLKSGIDKTHSILSIILPPFVRNRVKDGMRYIAESQGEVTIIFCDIGYFEKICNDYKPFELSHFLDKIFSLFDALCESTGVTKIETVGKTYMACAGLKDSDKELPFSLRKENHGRRAIEFALAILQEIQEISLKNENFLQVKIGINSGTVVAGVVGQHKPQFSLVGDTVNTASRMCSTLDNYNSIQISSSTYALVKEFTEYEFKQREVTAKGLGIVKTYVVTEAIQNNSDAAGGTNVLGRVHSSCLSYVSEKSVASDTESVKKSESRNSNTWKLQLFKMQNRTSMINSSPSIFHMRSECDENEFDFREQNLKKNNFSVFISIIIAIIAFSLMLVFNTLLLTLFNHFIPISALIVRGVTLLCLALILLTYNKLYFGKKFMYAFILTDVLMQTVMFLNIGLNGNILIDLIGLEMVYILMLLCQVMRNPLFPTIFTIFCNIAIWLILSGLYSSFLDHLINAILALIFTALHIKSKYSQEKNERNNYNLKILGDKELKENETLLVQMMPPHVLEHLENEKVFTDRLKNVTLMYADIVGFTAWSNGKTPNQVIKMLSNLFTQFDNLCVEYDVYKVHTIGDCYVVMGYTGKTQRSPAQECVNVIKMAYRMIEVIQLENQKHNSELNMRIGVHTGEVIAGVIGTSIVRYDIWGPDVLIANKMESNGTPKRIKISEDTKEMLTNRVESGFVYEESESIQIDFLRMTKKTYYLECVDLKDLVYY